MKAIYLITAVMLLSSGSLLAQSMKNSFSLSAGPSFPVGKFAQSDLSNTKIGNASSGITAALSYSHKLKNNFRVEAMFYGQRNRLSRTHMEKELSEKTYFQDFGPRYYTNWKVDDKKWYAGALLLGLSKQIPLSGLTEGLSVVPKVMAGMSYVQAPQIYAVSSMDTSYAVYERKNGHGIVPAFLVAVAFNYQINNRISVYAGIDYFRSGALPLNDHISKITATNGGYVWPGIVGFENSRNPPISFEESGDYKISRQSVNPMLGLRVSF